MRRAKRTVRSRAAALRALAAATCAIALTASIATVGVIGSPTAAHAATPLLNENFMGTSVSDPAVVPLGAACLTGASNPSSPPLGHSTLSHCGSHQNGPVPSIGGAPNGWLQLTDTGGNKTGGILYNQALPATGGLIVEFDQAQYGGSAADGISFFLSDGAYNLTATGAPGGSLGYAQRLDGSTWEQGVHHGFLGLALDAWGNYPRNNEQRGLGCTLPGENAGYDAGNESNYRPNVTIRGPGRQDINGNWLNGYCLWASTSSNGASQASNWPYSWSLRGSDSDTSANNVRAVNAIRTVRITILPTDVSGFTTITVEIDPDGTGPLAYVPMLTYTTSVEVPSTYKFGFSSSTGGSTDVHLIRNLKVQTYTDIEGLGLVKSINNASPLYKTVYDVGDQIPYNFLLTNGGVALHTVQVHDPLVGTITCPATTLAAQGNPGSSMSCTGIHTVTEQDVIDAAANDNDLPNTAYATGVFSSTPVTSNNSTATAKLADPDPKIELTKTAAFNDLNSNGEPNIGETITYSFEVENTGNITLAPVTITDPLPGLSPALANAACVASLAPGATATCSSTATLTLTVNHLETGNVPNTATANGVSPHDPALTASDTDNANVLTPARPEIELTKIATLTTDANSNSLADEGDVVTYTFSVTNTGNIPLTNVTITDPLPGLSPALTNAACVASLAVGQTLTCTASATYTVTRADLRRPDIENTATANAVAPGTIPNPSDTDDVTVTTGPPVLGLTLVKDVVVGTTAAPGVPADWTLTATPVAIAGQGPVSGHGDPPVAGSVNDVSVKPGTYNLTESGPPGYTASTWVCVDSDNDPVTVTGGAVTLTASKDVTCTITNTAIPGTVTWDKVNTDTVPQHLTGSVWTLTGPSFPGGVQIADCDEALPANCTGQDQNNEAGKFAIAGLAWGSYTLVEYAAPLGHALDATVHNFTVGGNVAAGCAPTNHTCIDLGAFANQRMDALVLPLTGGLPRDYLVIAGFSTIFLALVLGVIQRRRKGSGGRHEAQIGIRS